MAVYGAVRLDLEIILSHFVVESVGPADTSVHIGQGLGCFLSLPVGIYQILQLAPLGLRFVHGVVQHGVRRSGACAAVQHGLVSRGLSCGQGLFIVALGQIQQRGVQQVLLAVCMLDHILLDIEHIAEHHYRSAGSAGAGLLSHLHGILILSMTQHGIRVRESLGLIVVVALVAVLYAVSYGIRQCAVGIVWGAVARGRIQVLLIVLLERVPPLVLVLITLFEVMLHALLELHDIVGILGYIVKVIVLFTVIIVLLGCAVGIQEVARYRVISAVRQIVQHVQGVQVHDCQLVHHHGTP